MSGVPWNLLAAGWAALAVAFALLWLRQRATRDATSVDVLWAAGLAFLAVLFAVSTDGEPARRALVALLAGGATTRLALHLALDRAKKPVEDGRYRALRERWGANADRNFFVFFQAQALLDALLAVPFLIACASTAPIGALDVAAAGLALVALVGEAVADGQLARFRREVQNRGRTCRVGLWRYSRHPNYFFQWLLWCAYALFALHAPLGWIGIASPAAMLFLILRVTGIPPTEEQALRSRGDDYRDYQRTTSAFVPWFPKTRTT